MVIMLGFQHILSSYIKFKPSINSPDKSVRGVMKRWCIYLSGELSPEATRTDSYRAASNKKDFYAHVEAEKD